MEIALTVGLTLIAFCFIIIIIKKKENNAFKKIVYRQSDMHNILKDFFFKDIDDDKVVILDKKAYWISNNIFYVGEAVDGKVKPETGQPLDTSNMSKREIDKMLFILDNLKNGKLNDSGSAGN
jgi:hypothetical protein